MGDEKQSVIPWHSETRLTRNGGIVESHFWKVINLNGFTYKASFGASSEIGRGVEIYVTTNENGGVIDLSVVGKSNITVNDGDIYKLVKTGLGGSGWDVVGFWTPSTILTPDGIITPYVQFDTTATPITNEEGLLQWNATDGTLDLGMLGGDVTQQIGQEMFIKVRNTSGSTIANGTPVYFSGRSGNRPTIEPAQSNAHSTSIVEGLTTGNIANNAEGFITTFGYVRQIKTNYSGVGDWGTTWNEGDVLYVSKTVAGQLTNVEPDAPHHSDVVGEVGVLGAAGIGSIFVRIDRHQNLEHLSDINGTELSADGQFPVWNNTAGYFDFDFNINDYLPSDTTSLIYIPYTGATGNVDLGANDFTVNTNTLFVDSSTGRVGIGTASPTTYLDINPTGATPSANLYTSDIINVFQNASAPGFNIVSASSAHPAHRGVFKATRARGTVASPTAVSNGDYVFSLLGAAYDGTNNHATAGIEMLIDGTVSTGNLPQAITFQTGATTTRTERMRIASDGNVGIGTASPSGTLDITSSGSTTPLVINKAAQTGVRETLMKASVSDAGTSAFYVYNGTIVNGAFAPTFVGMNNNNSTVASLNFQGFVTSANDTGTLPVVSFNALRSTSTTDPLNGTLSSLTTRVAFDFRSSNTIFTTILANGNMGIGTTTPSVKLHIHDTSANPALEFSGTTVPNFTGVGFGPNVTTQTTGRVTQASLANGGLAFLGFSANTNLVPAIAFTGHLGPTSPTQPAILFDSWKHNGATGRTALSSSEISAQWRNGGNALMTLLGGGNVGIGTTTPNSTLQVSGSFSTTTTTVTTTTITLNKTHHIVLVDDDTAGSMVTINLPAVSGNNGLQYVIKKIGSTANVVIDGNGSETIDGATTATLTTQYESITIVCNGVAWYII